MHVANMELLIDVGQLPASVFEEGLANEDESAGEEVEKQAPEKDRECPSILAEEQRTIRDQEFQLAHEIEADSKHNGDSDEKGVRDHVNVLRGTTCAFG